MSVSQVKKRFSEMESHLGRDKEGLRKLKLLKDEVNVLRTSLASTEDKVELADVIKTAARERADSAEQQAGELKKENESLRMQLRTVEFKMRLSESQQYIADEGDTEDADESEKSDGHVECKTLLKRLRRVLPQCPILTNKQTNRHCPTFIRQELAEGWSHSSIWALGASVAIIAAHEGGVTVVDPTGVIFMRDGDPKRSGMAMNFCRWFGRNLKIKYTKKSVHFGNTKPAELIDPQTQTRMADITAEFWNGADD